MAQLDTTVNRELPPPHGSKLPHILLWIIQIVALASPRFRGRSALFSVAILVLAVIANIEPCFTNNIAEAQPFTIAWSNYLSTLEKLVFHGDAAGPEPDFYRLDHEPGEALGYTGFGPYKLLWSIVLLINLRGVRWSYQVKNVPFTRPGEKRRAFLLRQIPNVIYYSLMADLMVQLGIRLFYTPVKGSIGAVNSKFLTLRHHNWIWSFSKSLVFGAQPYYFVCLQYNLCSIPAVLLGLSKPEVRISSRVSNMPEETFAILFYFLRISPT